MQTLQYRHQRPWVVCPPFPDYVEKFIGCVDLGYEAIPMLLDGEVLLEINQDGFLIENKKRGFVHLVKRKTKTDLMIGNLSMQKNLGPQDRELIAMYKAGLL